MASSASYDPVPLALTLLLFVLLIMGLGILYLQYRSARQDLEFCRTFRALHVQANQLIHNSSN